MLMKKYVQERYEVSGGFKYGSYTENSILPACS